MSSLSAINTPIQAAASTGASLGGIHQSLQAKEFQNVGAYAARWFYSKKEEPDPVVEHQKRVKHIKSGQTKAANASFRQTFTALLKSATENWNPETKLQVLLAVRECEQGAVKHIKKAWIENTMAQVLDPAQFKEIMEILKPRQKREAQAAQQTPQLFDPVISPPVSILDPTVAPPSGQANWKSTSLCYSGNEGLWIGTNGTALTVQLFNLSSNVFTRIDNTTAAIQKSITQITIDVINTACANGVYNIVSQNWAATATYISGIVTHIWYGPDPVEFGETPLPNRAWQVVNIPGAGYQTNIEFEIFSTDWYLYRPFTSFIANAAEALEPGLMSFTDGSIRALQGNSSGIYEYPFDTSQTLGSSAEINGKQAAGLLRAPRTPLTVGKPLSLIEQTSTQMNVKTYNPAIPPPKIASSRFLGNANSSAEFAFIESCDSEIKVYARPVFDQATSTWGITIDFVNATNNSSSILNGGEFTLSNTSGSNHPNATLGCSSNYTAVVAYLNQTQDAVEQTINLVVGVPSPVVASSLSGVPSPVSVPSPVVGPSPVKVPSPVYVPSPVVAPSLVKVPSPVYVPSPSLAPSPPLVPSSVVAPSPVKVPSPVSVLSPSLAPSPPSVPGPVVAPSPVKVPSPVSFPSPVVFRSPVTVPSPVSVQSPSAAPSPGVVLSPLVAPSLVNVPSPSAAPSPGVVLSPLVAPSLVNVPSPSAAPSPGVVLSPLVAPSLVNVPSLSAAPSPGVVPSPFVAPSPGNVPSPALVPSSVTPSAAIEQIVITVKIDPQLGVTPVAAKSVVSFSNNTANFEIVSDGDYEFKFISNGTVVPTDTEFPVADIGLMNFTHVNISGTQIPILKGCDIQNVCNISQPATPPPETVVLTNTSGVPIIAIVTPIGVIVVVAAVAGAIYYFAVYRKKQKKDVADRMEYLQKHPTRIPSQRSDYQLPKLDDSATRYHTSTYNRRYSNAEERQNNNANNGEAAI